MKPGLRTKLVFPLIVSLLILTGIFHFYLAPRMVADEKEHFFSYQQKYLQAVERVVSRLILSGDLAELYASMDEYDTENEHWLQVAIHDVNGKQLYPLDSLETYSGDYIERLEHDIYGDENLVGNIVVWIDWFDEQEEIFENVDDIELILFIVFSAVIIFSSIWLNRLIRSPIVELEEAAYKIAVGDYSSRLPVASDDELGMLTRAFEIMSVDLREHEEEIVKAKEIAEKANNAKSELLRRVTHELRTPMNAILGFAQLLESDTVNPLDEQHKVLLDEILIAGKNLLSLIDHVLELSKIESDEITLIAEPTSLNNIVHECITLSTETTNNDNDVQFSSQLPEQDIMLMVDYQHFRDVLLYIISNAVKYNRVSGTVTISVEEMPSTIRIAVSDQGEGISHDDMDKLFQPFERLGKENTDTRGLGMGLILSKRLIEMMGGSIEIHSTEGKGTTVWLTVNKVSEKQLEDKIAV